MIDVVVQGAEDLLALSKRLKAAGQTELRKELNKAVRDAAKPLIPLVRAAARSSLPRRGGLADRIGAKPYRVKIATGRNPGVSIVGTKVDPRINAGRVYHPVFGRRPGVVQSVAPGYFSDTIQGQAEPIRTALVTTLSDFAERVTSG